MLHFHLFRRTMPGRRPRLAVRLAQACRLPAPLRACWAIVSYGPCTTSSPRGPCSLFGAERLGDAAGGRTPYPMSERSADTWNAVPGIVVDSAGSIHVMWAGCGNPVARCYRFSSDGGSTWSDSSKPFSDLVGSSGRDAMVADPYGGVRWFGSLRYPQALYAAELAEGIWADPPQAVVHEGSYGGLGSGHFPAMTISGGNRVHVTVVESDGGPLWHLRGTTSFPAIAVAPLPTIPVPTPSLAATADSTANSGATVIPAVTAVPASNSGYATEAFPLVLASATAAVVVVVAVVFAFRIRDR